MKLFIWERVDGVSDNYHDGGGVVAIAATLERARELLPKKCTARNEKPDHETEVVQQPERVFLFNDAGCC